MAEHATCPRCGANGVPIIYGFPSAAVMDKVEAGLAQMGGCVITGTEPRWACPACQNRWRTDTPGQPAQVARTDTPELRRTSPARPPAADTGLRNVRPADAAPSPRRTTSGAARTESGPRTRRDDTGSGRKPHPS
ncbi:hypothetical protein AB0H76_20935 [Nocardia sp. NPDC050712]|uniref:hypothetical protein n=1 Tax=Nocardia sp. NPDC050712 TaxID=3155518 RepID=UPI0033F0AD0E